MMHSNQPRVAALSLGLLLTVFVSATASAETAQFRIVFDDVPGGTQLETGEINKGIEILEVAYAEGSVDEGEALATLCGAYLLKKALIEAKSVCRKAADRYPGKSSLNNYGIYLAIIGDFEGALRNFKKVQPLRLEEYVEFLRNRDIGLIALQNEAVVLEYQAGHKNMQNEAIRFSAKIQELVP